METPQWNVRDCGLSGAAAPSSGGTESCTLRKPKAFLLFYIFYTEKAMAPHSSTLAWKIPRTEEPGGLQSMGSLRVGHD